MHKINPLKLIDIFFQIYRLLFIFVIKYYIVICGYNLVVECHASDLIARVRFSLPAPLSKIVAPDENIEKSTVKVDFLSPLS